MPDKTQDDAVEQSRNGPEFVHDIYEEFVKVPEDASKIAAKPVSNAKWISIAVATVVTLGGPFIAATYSFFQQRRQEKQAERAKTVPILSS
jgi:hypothetical protein